MSFSRGLATASLLAAVAGCQPPPASVPDPLESEDVAFEGADEEGSSAAGISDERELLEAASLEGSRGNLEPVRWEGELTRGMERARRERRAAVIWVHADWATTSVQMERRVWGDPRVRRAMRTLVPVRIDVTDGNHGNQGQMGRIPVQVVPAVVVLDWQGREIGRVERSSDPQPVLELLLRAGSE